MNTGNSYLIGILNPISYFVCEKGTPNLYPSYTQATSLVGYYCCPLWILLERMNQTKNINTNLDQSVFPISHNEPPIFITINRLKIGLSKELINHSLLGVAGNNSVYPNKTKGHAQY